MKLEVGGKYKYKNDYRDYYITVLCIDGDRFWAKDNKGNYLGHIMERDLIPYEELVKEVEWKTFLIEFDNTSIHTRQLFQFHSLEEANNYFSHKPSLVTEIKLNFETV